MFIGRVMHANMYVFALNIRSHTSNNIKENFAFLFLKKFDAHVT